MRTVWFGMVGAVIGSLGMIFREDAKRKRKPFCVVVFHFSLIELLIKITCQIYLYAVYYLARIGKVFRREIVAFTDADCGKPFQFPHPDFNRFPMCFDQARIEQ